MPRWDRKTPSLLVGGVLLLALFSAAAESPSLLRFDIPSEPLGQALRAYGQTAHQSLIFTQNLVDGISAPALQGEFTADAALRVLLKGTGLVIERSPSGAVMIRRQAQSQKSPPELKASAAERSDHDSID